MLIDSDKLSVQDIAHILEHPNPNIALSVYSHFFNKENNIICNVIDNYFNNIIKTSPFDFDKIKKPNK